MARESVRTCKHCGKSVEGREFYCSIDCIFWSKVDIRGPDECWPWLGAKLKKSGYAIINISRKKKSRITTASRVSLAISLGKSLDDLDEDIHACHTCDNTNCMNPRHLFEGTAKANNEDKVSKSRQSKGQTHGMSRLTEEQARAILADPRTHDEIALDYDIARTAITRIKNGTRWRHLQP